MGLPFTVSTVPMANREGRKQRRLIAERRGLAIHPVAGDREATRGDHRSSRAIRGSSLPGEHPARSAGDPPGSGVAQVPEHWRAPPVMSTQEVRMDLVAGGHRVERSACRGCTVRRSSPRPKACSERGRRARTGKPSSASTRPSPASSPAPAHGPRARLGEPPRLARRLGHLVLPRARPGSSVGSPEGLLARSMTSRSSASSPPAPRRRRSSTSSPRLSSSSQSADTSGVTVARRFTFRVTCRLDEPRRPVQPPRR